MVFTEHHAALHCKTIKCRLIIDEDDHKGWGKPHVGKGESWKTGIFAGRPLGTKSEKA